METPRFATVDSQADLEKALESVGVPAILKTRRLGYDGKGQVRIHARADAAEAWQALGGVPLILESLVSFDREVSVIGVRGRDGSFNTYPLTQNWHHKSILSASLSPAPEAAAIEKDAVDFARRLAEHLGYVGVFALELFVHQGRLLANEMAPRVHNSGHWTIEGSGTSQFENHLRAVAGMPLGSTASRGTSVMLNWIGALPDPLPILSEERAHWHDYGKGPREGRKVGHATLNGTPDELVASVERLGAALHREEQVAPVLAALRGR
jgi:5-(carboxyamino)imidazole ribonucleotide synthase